MVETTYPDIETHDLVLAENGNLWEYTGTETLVSPDLANDGFAGDWTQQTYTDLGSETAIALAVGEVVETSGDVLYEVTAAVTGDLLDSTLLAGSSFATFTADHDLTAASDSGSTTLAAYEVIRLYAADGTSTYHQNGSTAVSSLYLPKVTTSDLSLGSRSWCQHCRGLHRR